MGDNKHRNSYSNRGVNINIVPIFNEDNYLELLKLNESLIIEQVEVNVIFVKPMTTNRGVFQKALKNSGFWELNGFVNQNSMFSLVHYSPPYFIMENRSSGWIDLLDSSRPPPLNIQLAGILNQVVLDFGILTLPSINDIIIPPRKQLHPHHQMILDSVEILKQHLALIQIVRLFKRSFINK
ncbi:hypothetical protein ACTFIV_004204 [Dictyostelium citrinum]